MAKLVEGPKMSGTIGGLNYYMLEDQCVIRTPKSFNKRAYKEEGRCMGFKRSGKCLGAASKMLSKEVYHLLPEEEKVHGEFGKMCGKGNYLQRKEGKTLDEVKDIIMKEYKVGPYEELRKKAVNNELQCTASLEQLEIEGLRKKVEQLEGRVSELLLMVERLKEDRELNHISIKEEGDPDNKHIPIPAGNDEHSTGRITRSCISTHEQPADPADFEISIYKILPWHSLQEELHKMFNVVAGLLEKYQLKENVCLSRPMDEPFAFITPNPN